MRRLALSCAAPVAALLMVPGSRQLMTIQAPQSRPIAAAQLIKKVAFVNEFPRFARN
jgi:hypothetical protein